MEFETIFFNGTEENPLSRHSVRTIQGTALSNRIVKEWVTAKLSEYKNVDITVNLMSPKMHSVVSGRYGNQMYQCPIFITDALSMINIDMIDEVVRWMPVLVDINKLIESGELERGDTWRYEGKSYSNDVLTDLQVYAFTKRDFVTLINVLPFFKRVLKNHIHIFESTAWDLPSVRKLLKA